METIKHFLTTIDIFGITYSFRYKQKERYQTVLGGFVLILFLALVLAFGIYNFIPFINRKNYAIVYYSMNLAVTEEVNLFKSESNFAFGVLCDNNKNEKLSVNDLLDLKSSYILYAKHSNGTYQKYPKELKTHKCNYEDFYNKYNEQMDYLGLSKFECLDEREGSLQGIYADQIFSYFEFTVQSKNDLELTKLNKFLFENDCKLQIIYMDIIIDLNNYNEPIKHYLNELFIQLNPTLFIKRNMYYMNQYFTNDDYLIFAFGDEEPDSKTVYSRYDEYSLYMGLERNITRQYNYDKFAKLYMRADLKKTIINRKYQKVMEFYADASSILVSLYEVIYLILNFIDYFYAYHSVSKEIFFFKDVEEDYNYNIFKKGKQIQSLISLIDQKGKNINVEIFESDSKKVKILELNNNYNEIKIYKNNRRKKEKEKESRTNSKLIASKILNHQKNNDKYEYILKEKDIDSNRQLASDKTIKEKNRHNTDILNIKSNKKAEFHFKNLSRNNKEKNIIQNITKENKSDIVKNSFNIFEIIITQFLRCCMSRRMTIKNNVNKNANEIINKKLDIISYIRNMILFDIMNRTIIDNGRNDIINFICRPIISADQNQTDSFGQFYENYKEEDFERFKNNITELMKKPQKLDKENKLISISKKHLKAFV